MSHHPHPNWSFWSQSVSGHCIVRSPGSLPSWSLTQLYLTTQWLLVHKRKHASMCMLSRSGNNATSPVTWNSPCSAQDSKKQKGTLAKWEQRTNGRKYSQELQLKFFFFFKVAQTQTSAQLCFFCFFTKGKNNGGLKHRQELWVHKVSWVSQVMAECWTPRGWLFNSLRAGTASVLHNPPAFPAAAVETASLIWTGHERPAWDIQPPLSYGAQLWCARATTRQQEAGVTNLCGGWPIRRSRPRCGWPARLFEDTGLVCFFWGGGKSANQGGQDVRNVLGRNLLALVKSNPV